MSRRRDAYLSHWRRTSRALRTTLARRALGGLCLSLLLLASLNLAARAFGAEVHALSLGRVRERAIALRLLIRHALHCEHGDEAAREAVRAAAERHGVPVRLALAIARTESSWLHTRISSTGAMGLMQLMPGTAFELGVDDPFDVVQSADGGVRYLKRLLTLYRGDRRRAVAAYNAGFARVPLRGHMQLPSETRTYVGRVLSAL